MLTQRERFIALVDNDPLHFANAIVVLQGDGFVRAEHGGDLYLAGLAHRILITGGNAKGVAMADALKRSMPAGIPRDLIDVDMTSINTREQALYTVAVARANKWHVILLVASHYHQYRAYLTFLKAMQESNYEFWIINAPARDLAWYDDNDRIELLDDEFFKIGEYSKLGHIASYESAIQYQRRKEEALR